MKTRNVMCMCVMTMVFLTAPTVYANLAAAASTQLASTLEHTKIPDEKNPVDDNDISRFTNTIVLIKDFYVQPVGDRSLLNDAIRGMVSGLDPHSEYLDKEAYKTLLTATSGEFGGVGIEVTPEFGVLKIIPMRVHLILEVVSGIFLAASPWLFGFSAQVFLPHFILGLVEILAGLLTNPSKKDTNRLI